MKQVDFFEALVRWSGVAVWAFVAYTFVTSILTELFYGASMGIGSLLIFTAAGIVIGWVFMKKPEIIIGFVYGKQAYSSE